MRCFPQWGHLSCVSIELSTQAARPKPKTKARALVANAGLLSRYALAFPRPGIGHLELAWAGVSCVAFVTTVSSYRANRHRASGLRPRPYWIIAGTAGRWDVG